MLEKVVILLGVWILSDAVYSIMLYYNKPDYTGKIMQNWSRDHSIRLIRGAIGIILVIGGFIG